MRWTIADKNTRRKVSIAIGIFSFFALPVLFGIKRFIAEGTFISVYISTLWTYLGLFLLASVSIGYACTFFFRNALSAPAIKAGDGQHGEADWLEGDEKEKTYPTVKHGREEKAGFLVGTEKSNEWRPDISDNNILILAPPGGGKTTTQFIPSIAYNANVEKNTKRGPSMLVTDMKGTLYRACAKMLRDSGYVVQVLNFRSIFHGSQFNIMYKVNKAIDRYVASKEEKERAIAYGEAERYAKILSDAIVDNGGSPSSKSSASDYFDETSKGLITGMILLVSEYGNADERHIVSVYNMVLEMNGLSEEGNSRRQGNSAANQKSKLDTLLDKIDNMRIRNYTGPTTSADQRTLMNVFSSALSKLSRFIDAEMEQLICGHSEELEASHFLDKPTVIFLICPDENTTRHFFVSLYIRLFANELIEIAESSIGGVLPREVLFFLDEFGNMPGIYDADVLFSAIRSRLVRIMIALQSYEQLRKNYSRERAGIIEDSCQILMFTFISPSATETAEKLSKILGNETVMTASSSTGGDGRTSYTTSLTGKPLMSAASLVGVKWGTWIVVKAGRKPLKSQLNHYSAFLKLDEEDVTTIPEFEFAITQKSSFNSMEYSIQYPNTRMWKGMFDVEGA